MCQKPKSVSRAGAKQLIKTIISYHNKVVHGKGQQLGYDHRELLTKVSISECTPEELSAARKELMNLKKTHGNAIVKFRFAYIDKTCFTAEADHNFISELESIGYSF